MEETTAKKNGKTAEDKPTLQERGLRMPGEWELHEGTLLIWPHNVKTWPGLFDSIPPIFARMAAEIAKGEQVWIIVSTDVSTDVIKHHLKEANADTRFIDFLFAPTNDSWVRDCGPIYVMKEEEGIRQRLALNWGYNAWGEKYPPFDDDNALPTKIAPLLDDAIETIPMILEGGSIDVNGQGYLLTTESCLLNPNRNPTLDKAQIETKLRENLGVRKITWLGDGIVGDDTDGHVDDMTRFISEKVVVTSVETNESDENCSTLQANREQLIGELSPKGFEIVDLPMPDPLYHQGHRLPASYANFYIANEVVLVPTFGSVKDKLALGILGDLMPSRRVVGINCTELVWGLGAFHCLTQQIPLAT